MGFYVHTLTGRDPAVLYIGKGKGSQRWQRAIDAHTGKGRESPRPGEDTLENEIAKLAAMQGLGGILSREGSPLKRWRERTKGWAGMNIPEPKTDAARKAAFILIIRKLVENPI